MCNKGKTETHSSVDDPGTVLHPGNLLLVDEAAGLFVERSVDGQDVKLAKELLEVFNAAGADRLLSLLGHGLVIVVEELLAVERLQALEDSVANAASTKGADDLALQIVRVAGSLSDVPLTVAGLVVSRNKVADQVEDLNQHQEQPRRGPDFRLDTILPFRV